MRLSSPLWWRIAEVEYTQIGARTLALLLFSLLAAPSLAFDLEGHRGTRGLAPENTLAAQEPMAATADN